MLAVNKKRFQDVKTKPTIDKQTNNWPTILFETEHFRFEKTGPRQIQTQDLYRPRHIISRLSWSRKLRGFNL